MVALLHDLGHLAADGRAVVQGGQRRRRALSRPLFRAVGDRHAGDAAPLRGCRGRPVRGPVARGRVRSPRRCAPPSGSTRRRCRCRRCRRTCRPCRGAASPSTRPSASWPTPASRCSTRGWSRTPAEAARVGPQIGERLVLKIVSADIPHKTEMGGVMLDIPAAEAGAAFDRMIARIKERAPRAVLDGVLDLADAARRRSRRSSACRTIRCSAPSSCSGWAASLSRSCAT